MKRFVLFSTLTPTNSEKILGLIFPTEISNKVIAYMPSDGKNIKQKYVDEWKKYAKKHGAEFRLINNSKINDQGEKAKLLNSNILVITGGNTFTLLDNLRKSGLDKAIKEFSNKSEFVLSGFSAGSLVLTPTIEICNLPNFDENLVSMKDLTGLNIIDFEVFPHYEAERHGKLLSNYRKSAENEIREISDDEVITINL